jgi:hypothetical protein
MFLAQQQKYLYVQGVCCGKDSSNEIMVDRDINGIVIGPWLGPCYRCETHVSRVCTDCQRFVCDDCSQKCTVCRNHFCPECLWKAQRPIWVCKYCVAEKVLAEA